MYYIRELSGSDYWDSDRSQWTPADQATRYETIDAALAEARAECGTRSWQIIDDETGDTVIAAPYGQHPHSAAS